MGWDTVPWMVGGGAQHTPDVGRVLAYVAFNGEEGVLGPSDLVVKASAQPGAQVHVMAGACSIIARSPGNPYQAYVGRLPSEDVVSVAGTTSAGARHDLVIARVEDPFDDAAGNWPDPVDAKVGPYIFTRVIAGVPAGTTNIRQVSGHANDTAITLARIDIPASTSAIQQSYIVDLRNRPNPRRERVLLAKAFTSGESEVLAAYSSAGGEQWPSSTTWQCTVPEWATRARIVASWAGVNVPPGNVNGTVYARLGATNDASAVTTQSTGYDTMGLTQYSRQTLEASDDIAIPAGLRGRTIPVYLWGNIGTIFSGGDAARIKLDAYSSARLDIEFIERPEG